jgi:phosphatidylserine synthase
MLDRILRPVIDPPLNAMGRGLARAGITANAVTVCGGALALLAAAAIASGRYGLGLALIVLNRIVDGLDGAVARASRAGSAGLTDTGGYLDSLFDYLFYASIPLAFAIADTARNALPAAAVLASFLLTASSFLAYAALAAKRAVTSSEQGEKSFYYSRGLIEGTETIAAFVAMAIWPEHFPAIAWGLAALCVITAALRSASALRSFR